MSFHHREIPDHPIHLLMWMSSSRQPPAGARSHTSRPASGCAPLADHRLAADPADNYRFITLPQNEDTDADFWAIAMRVLARPIRSALR